MKIALGSFWAVGQGQSAPPAQPLSVALCANHPCKRELGWIMEDAIQSGVEGVSILSQQGPFSKIVGMIPAYYI